MNRQEFLELVLQAKNNVNKTTNDISFDIRMQWSSVDRFEKGTHNVNLNIVFKYLSAINHKLSILSSSGSKTICFDYESLIKFIVKERTGKYSQRKLGEVAHVSFQTIAKAESFNVVMSIDTLLKILEVLNCTITIEPK